MDQDNPSQEDIEFRLFQEALEHSTPTERAAFLDRACSGNQTLRDSVEDLLANHVEDSFLESPATGVGSSINQIPIPESISEKPGSEIGPADKLGRGRYKLLQKIGEGGFGVVYLAEQQEPVKRQVALKIIKPGMDTRSVVARFEAERQALALMNHPNIAKVLDGGVTESGRPYFVMEMIKGDQITDYCNQQRLSTPQRLELFILVCQTIQHAHQKGIIHRDIKPSNILVTMQDGLPVPKVIDFGIAKALDQPLTNKTLFTAFERFMGTPAYVSPEQAAMTGIDIDTRSDIYSLGVLLYELLTGQTPFDAKTLLNAGLDGMRRKIREEEPPRPSTRLTTLGAKALAEVARHHQSEPGKLRNLLRGELDWIVMKTLEKDRTRRYATANGLARDIERHLKHDPVEAAPPSISYRFYKYARRNRVTLMVLAALVLGTALSTWQTFRAKHARKIADVNLGKALAAQRSAVTNRMRAENLLSFLMGDLYKQLYNERHLNLLEPLVTEVNNYFQKLAPEEYTLESEFNLSKALAMQGNLARNRGDLKAGETNYLAAIEIMKRLTDQDPGNEIWHRQLARHYYAMSFIVESQGRTEERDLYLERSVELLKEVVNPTSSEPEARRQLARSYLQWGEKNLWQRVTPEMERRSLDYLSRAREIYRKLLEEDPSNASHAQQLARCIKYEAFSWRQSGEHQKSFKTFQEALQVTVSHANYSSSLGLRNESAWLHIHLAENYLNPEAGNDRARALQHLQSSLAIFKEITPLYETDYAYPGQFIHLGFARVNQKLGEFYRDDSLSMALPYFETIWDYYFQAHQASPLDTKIKASEIRHFKDLAKGWQQMLLDAREQNDELTMRESWRALVSLMSKRLESIEDGKGINALIDTYLALERKVSQEGNHEAVHNFHLAALCLTQRRSELTGRDNAPDLSVFPGYEDLYQSLPENNHVALPASLIAPEADWKYFDQGHSPPPDWNTIDFDDTDWESGPAPLGYTGAWFNTDIHFGGNRPSTHMTAYFRTMFSVEKPMLRQGLLFRLMRNDGAVVYLNGREMIRDNMPEGKVTYNTSASSAGGAWSRTNYLNFWTPANGLLNPTNVLAVEVHQSKAWSTQLGFALELLGNVPGPEELLKGKDLAAMSVFLKKQGVPLPESLIPNEWISKKSAIPDKSL